MTKHRKQKTTAFNKFMTAMIILFLAYIILSWFEVFILNIETGNLSDLNIFKIVASLINR